MGVKEVRAFFADRGLPYTVRELEKSTETVELAAQTLGVEPALIAKTLAFRVKEKGIILVTRGDARVDTKKFRQAFQAKPRMMTPDEVLAVTGHPVGGVCPFALKQPMEIFLDESLKPLETVYPAAGSPNSHIAISPGELALITRASWVDVCRGSREEVMHPPARGTG
ncbi:MAG TPA: YbaK/EbsC family protein [Deltaproteobacteria bacterium]|nr:YbaK/EbsC family protein [Deltaproteobacteria bacterium]HQI82080.1 YbaK/EbsC family protein [Deltaproteobacteria bacterium]